jgi:hypothetical protein
VNLGNKMCIAMQLDTSDWIRAGGSTSSHPKALLTVQHQPGVCAACEKNDIADKNDSGSGSTSTDDGTSADVTDKNGCQVGDRPSLTRCSGAGSMDSSRLSWDYEPFTTSLLKDSGECVPGVNMWGSDLPNMPLYGYTVLDCEEICAANPSCKAYVYLEQGCEDHPSPACWLKSTDQGSEQSEACSCMGIMAPSKYLMCSTASVPSTGTSSRDMLPPGVGCSTLPKADCCRKKDASRSEFYGTQPTPHTAHCAS